MNHSRSLMFFAVLLYVFSFSLRFYKFSNGMPFGDDHARDATVIMEHIQAKKPFVLGPKTSVGEFYVHPLYYYVMSVPLMLTQGNPFSMSFLIVLIESFTPVLLFIFVYRFWNLRSAQIAGVLYAISPFAIIFGSHAWSPNLVPFFSLLSLYGVFMYVFKKRHWGAYLGGLAAVGAFDMHFQGAVLCVFLVFVATMDIVRDVRNLKTWLISLAVVLLTFFPFLFDLELSAKNLTQMQHVFLNQGEVFQTVRTIPYFWNKIPRFFELSIGLETGGYFFGRVIFFVSSLLLGIRFLTEIRRTKRSPSMLLLIFFLISLICLRMYKGDKLDYYLLFMLYLPSTFLSLALDFIFQKFFVFPTLFLLYLVLRVQAATNYRGLVDYQAVHLLASHLQKTAPSAQLEQFRDVYYQSTFMYLWKYVLHQSVNSNSASQTAQIPLVSTYIYVCEEGVRCGDQQCNSHVGYKNSIPNEEIDLDAFQKGYSFSHADEVSLGNKHFFVVTYTKGQ